MKGGAVYTIFVSTSKVASVKVTQRFEPNGGGAFEVVFTFIMNSTFIWDFADSISVF